MIFEGYAIWTEEIHRDHVFEGRDSDSEHRTKETETYLDLRTDCILWFWYSSSEYLLFGFI